jgi:hypothetical protein
MMAFLFYNKRPLSLSFLMRSIDHYTTPCWEFTWNVCMTTIMRPAYVALTQVHSRRQCVSRKTAKRNMLGHYLRACIYVSCASTPLPFEILSLFTIYVNASLYYSYLRPGNYLQFICQQPFINWTRSLFSISVLVSDYYLRLGQYL